MDDLFTFWKDNKENMHSIDSSSLHIPQEGDSEESHFRKSVCFFSASGSARQASQPEPAMAERPLVLQSQILASETWHGKVIRTDGESLILDLRNAKQTTIRRIIRVRKNIVKGEVNSVFVGMTVSLLYNKKRTFKWENGYKEAVVETTEIRLRQPSLIPAEARRREIEEKMKRYSYMFSDDV